MEVERVVAGADRADRVADIAAAYDSNERDLFSFTLAVTRDHEAAADLVQETFLRLVRESRAGRFPDNPRAWLFRVAVNLARSRARRRIVVDRWRHLFAIFGADTSPSAEDEIVLRERDARVRTSVAALPTEARMALLLASDGRTGHEVASLIGRSEGATRTLLWRARRDLRRRMEDEADR